MFYAAVPALVASLLDKLSSFPLPRKTYMAGGTAATLYLGHRISTDIDLFTEEHFLTGPILDAIRQLHAVQVEEVSDRDSLVAEVDGVRLGLFHYPYPLLGPFSQDSVSPVPLASLNDISAMKAVAIVQRGTAKDFVDLKAIMEKTGMSLHKLTDLTLKKYGLQKDYTYHIRRGLVFFDEAERGLKEVILLRGPSLLSPIDASEWGGVKKFFVDVVL